MAQVYDSLGNIRKQKLLQPLSEADDSQIFDVKNYSYVKRLIRDRIYGTYLIGGCEGCGKSSLITMAAAADKDHGNLVVNVAFSDEDKIVDNFLFVILQAFVETIENKICLEEYDDKKEELQAYLLECEELIYYNIVMENVILKETDRYGEKSSSQELTRKGSAEGNIGPSFKFLNVGFSLGMQKSHTNLDKEGQKDDEKISVRITRTQRDENLWKKIMRGINLLERHKIIFIFDNLDHSAPEVITELFRHYKQVFVESSYFVFLLVDDAMYHHFGENDLVENSLYTCFTGTFYVGMFDFEDTVRFARRMFNERSITEVYELYYHSLGNLRLINSHYYLKRRGETLTLLKGILLKNLLDDPRVVYEDRAYHDVLVRRYKRAVKMMFDQRAFSIEEMVQALEENDNLFCTWPDYDEIIRSLIRYLEEKIPGAIEKPGEDRYFLNYSYLYREHESICSGILQQRPLRKPDRWQYIQIDDMYPKLNVRETAERLNERFAIQPDLSLSRLETADGRILCRIMMSILETNLDADGLRLMEISREVTVSEIEYVSTAKRVEYSAALLIRIGDYQYAYYGTIDWKDAKAREAMDKLVGKAAVFGVKAEPISVGEYECVPDVIRGIRGVKKSEESLTDFYGF